ncbi:MAG: hypothetical protein ACC628_00060 [Pirellulaceae bacterium]
MKTMRRWTCFCLSYVLLTSPGLSVVAEDAPSFDYFHNSWNVVGLKDYQQGARVTPDSQILLGGKGEDRVTYEGSLRLRFGRNLMPLSRRQVKTALDGWIPVMLFSARDGEVQYDFKVWATPLPSVQDWKKCYNWPVEGENFLVWVTVAVTNGGDQPASAKLVAERRGPGATGEPWNYAWSLRPGEAATAVLRVPFQPVADPTVYEEEDPDLWLQRTVDFWKGLMDRAARIEVPCRKATESLLAAHVCQMIANDHGQLQGGEGFYDHFYIRDGGYQILQLEEAGLWDVAATAIESYFNAQRPDGRFESQTDQFDANGQAIWVLWQYGKITGDRAWLADAYPRMRRAVDWTMKARRTAPGDSPFAGVLPAAPADGEYLWDGKHHIVGYDLWNLRGILCTADAAGALGRQAEADELFAEAERYRAAIDAAWKRTGLSYFPPSWEKEGTHWGNTETLWPTEVFDRHDPRVGALVDEVRLNHGGGFLEGTIRWLGHPDAIHPYMSSYTTMADLARGNHEQTVKDFYWYLLHTTASHAFPEGIYFKPRIAWSNTIPHVTGASNFAFLLRHMLIHERGDELHLLSAVPDGWLDPGNLIRVQRAPTHFGPIDLTVRGVSSGVEVEFVGPHRNPPSKVTLTLPEARPLVGTLDGVHVVRRSDQSMRWDFASVVELYQQQEPYWKPIPGLVTLPPEGGVSAQACTFLDLSAVAVTDPFTAPFGVPNPGADYLFTGMPVGRVNVSGVPFKIMDAKSNGGRSMVVLHSPKSPQGVKFPNQVEIAVGQVGRRLFFLGNVHGWSARDSGAGPWGAVAEYVIHYADGRQQIVPLVPGRTIDEWVGSPIATEVQVALAGQRWHLNLLAVDLRPVKINTVVFRDLGTPSAPVLVAATLEK